MYMYVFRCLSLSSLVILLEKQMHEFLLLVDENIARLAIKNYGFGGYAWFRSNGFFNFDTGWHGGSNKDNNGIK